VDNSKIDKEKANALRSELQQALGWNASISEDSEKTLEYMQRLKRWAEDWEVDYRMLERFLDGKNPHNKNLQLMYDKYLLNTLYKIRTAGDLRMYFNYGQSIKPFITINMHHEVARDLDNFISNNSQEVSALADNIQSSIDAWRSDLPCLMTEYLKKMDSFISSESVKNIFENTLVKNNKVCIYGNKLPLFMAKQDFNYVTQLVIAFEYEEDILPMNVDFEQLNFLRQREKDEGEDNSINS
tara:strand:- start:1 stop:723 length:723 start_codon:yes stop_codon:yes gene_type:complete